jgi:hypothetical protein
MIVMDAPLDEVPGMNPTAATVPADGLVNVAAARFCFAAVSCAVSESMDAWSAAS